MPRRLCSAYFLLQPIVIQNMLHHTEFKLSALDLTYSTRCPPQEVLQKMVDSGKGSCNLLCIERLFQNVAVVVSGHIRDGEGSQLRLPCVALSKRWWRGGRMKERGIRGSDELGAAPTVQSHLEGFDRTDLQDRQCCTAHSCTPFFPSPHSVCLLTTAQDLCQGIQLIVLGTDT